MESYHIISHTNCFPLESERDLSINFVGKTRTHDSPTGNILPRVYLAIRKERLEGTKDIVIFKYKMRLQIQVDTRSERMKNWLCKAPSQIVKKEGQRVALLFGVILYMPWDIIREKWCLWPGDGHVLIALWPQCSLSPQRPEPLCWLCYRRSLSVPLSRCSPPPGAGPRGSSSASRGAGAATCCVRSLAWHPPAGTGGGHFYGHGWI